MKFHTINQKAIKLVISFWPLQLLGLLILFGSLCVFGYLKIQYSIICKEKQPDLARQCSLESNLNPIYHSSTPLGVLTKAVVMSQPTSKGGITYWVQLLTENGSIHLTGGSSSGRASKDAAAESINHYIDTSSATRFEIPYATPLWVFGLAGVFSLLGIYLMIGFRSTLIEFDSGLQSVTIKRKGLFLKEIKLEFSKIDKIILEEFRRRNVLTYRLAFLLKNNTAIPFVKTYDSNKVKKEIIAKQLNDFMTAKVQA